MTIAFGRQRHAVFQDQWFGDEPLQTKSVHLEIGRIADRSQQVDMNVVNTVRGHLKTG